MNEPDPHKIDGDCRIRRVSNDSHDHNEEAAVFELCLNSYPSKTKSRAKSTGKDDNREWRVRFYDRVVCPPPDVAYASMRYTNTHAPYSCNGNLPESLKTCRKYRRFATSQIKIGKC